MLAASQAYSSWCGPGLPGIAVPSSWWLTWVPQNSMAGQHDSALRSCCQWPHTGHPMRGHPLLRELHWGRVGTSHLA